MDFCVFSLHALEQVLHAHLDKWVGSLVLGLLLGPHDLCVGVALEVLLNRLEWEGSKLLNADDCDVADTKLGSLGLQVVVDLTAAEDYSSYLIILCHVLAFVLDHLGEVQAFRERLDVRSRTFQFKNLLR